MKNEYKVVGAFLLVETAETAEPKKSRVSTDSYRNGWDTIWGKARVGQA